MENIKDYQQYLRGYNYTGITPVIIDSYTVLCIFAQKYANTHN